MRKGVGHPKLTMPWLMIVYRDDLPNRHLTVLSSTGPNSTFVGKMLTYHTQGDYSIHVWEILVLISLDVDRLVRLISKMA